MTLGDPEQLMKEARFYKEALGDGRGGGEVEGGGRSITFKPAARFGSVPDRLSGRMHRIRERNSDFPDDLLKLVLTAKDIDEFERKLGEIG